MTTLSGQTIRELKIISPFEERTRRNGLTYGVGSASYDCRIDLNEHVSNQLVLFPGDFALASTVEEFRMPKNVCGFVKDKSTYARRGLSLYNTFIDPGWNGFLTLEMVNNGKGVITLTDLDPICQIVFMFLDKEAENPYEGKYQNQKRGPVDAKFEK